MHKTTPNKATEVPEIEDICNSSKIITSTREHLTFVRGLCSNLKKPVLAQVTLDGKKVLLLSSTEERVGPNSPDPDLQIGERRRKKRNRRREEGGRGEVEGGQIPSPGHFLGLQEVRRGLGDMRHKGIARSWVARILGSGSPLFGRSNRPGSSSLKDRTLLWLLKSS